MQPVPDPLTRAPSRQSPAHRLSPALLLLLAGLPATAQPPDFPSPVGYTEAREHSIRRSVQLTGSVAARRSSVVASEVAGLVVELLAREGEYVRQGQPIARLRQETVELELQAVRAQLREAEARRDLARRNLERARELYDSQVVSRQHLDDAASELAAWEGRVESLAAELARVQDTLDRSVIRAPFSGIVVYEHTQIGEWMEVGGRVVELLSLEDLEAVVEVPDRYFQDFRRGTPARVTFENLPGLEIDGRVSAVVPRADPQARTFRVKVGIPNRERKIAVGMLARVAFAVGEPYRAVVVPKDAIVRRGNRSLIYRIQGDASTVEELEVETGAATGEWIAVQGPIRPGDRVVTRGNERLQDGQTVQGQAVEYPLP